MVMENLPLSKEGYNQGWAEWNDFIRYNPGARHRRRLVRNAAKKLKFSTVLDVGCGNGELLSILSELNPDAKLSGSDLSDFVVNQNAKKMPNVNWRVLNLQESRFQDQFDLVVCSEVIEHLVDQKTAFANLAAMVKPGGHLLMTCPTGKIYPTEVNFGHVKHPSVAELKSYARENRMQTLRAEAWGFPVYNFTKYLSNVNPEWAVKNFANGKYGAFEKFSSGMLYFANFFNVPTNLGAQLILLFRKN